MFFAVIVGLHSVTTWSRKILLHLLSTTNIIFLNHSLFVKLQNVLIVCGNLDWRWKYLDYFP